jgi:peptide/nickel transport system permease protein
VVRFILRRLGVTVVLLFVLLALLFILQHVSPTDPAAAYLGSKASPAQVAAVRRHLGLDDPLIVQYLHYVWHALHFNLGISLRTHRPVASDIGTYFPATAELVLFAFVLAVLLGSLFAFSGALKWPGGRAYRGVLLVGAEAPSFLLGLVGIVLFYSDLGWLPVAGRGPTSTSPTGFVLIDSLLHANLSEFGSGLQHLILPGLALALLPALAIGRVMRSSIEQNLSAPHVRTARSKGLRESAVFLRHVLRNSIGPAISMAGLQLGGMFAGVVVIEQIFSWPGIGLYLGESIANDDFPAIAAVTLLLGSIYIAANALVDILQTAADPRLTL